MGLQGFSLFVRLYAGVCVCVCARVFDLVEVLSVEVVQGFVSFWMTACIGPLTLSQSKHSAFFLLLLLLLLFRAAHMYKNTSENEFGSN